ncbi:MAG: hypothetical protein EZS28_000093 [Streblomastix strix]|uniref:Uncharacterized protein n=1 Tax=Streblomastix strix TaxID=222440 RepID=A0A5J4XBS6_9EUKA|nr:MAG: hypothetical protein EZS28_000093 [Streblomastix strix]
MSSLKKSKFQEFDLSVEGQLNLNKRGIDSFAIFSDKIDVSKILSLLLQSNPIINFEFFPVFPNLIELFLQGSQITSFKGLQKQPKLRKVIDEDKLTNKEKVDASFYGPMLQNLLFEGFLIGDLPDTVPKYCKTLIRNSNLEGDVAGIVDIVECSPEESIIIPTQSTKRQSSMTGKLSSRPQSPSELQSSSRRNSQSSISSASSIQNKPKLNDQRQQNQQSESKNDKIIKIPSKVTKPLAVIPSQRLQIQNNLDGKPPKGQIETKNENVKDLQTINSEKALLQEQQKTNLILDKNQKNTPSKNKLDIKVKRIYKQDNANEDDIISKPEENKVTQKVSKPRSVTPSTSQLNNKLGNNPKNPNKGNVDSTQKSVHIPTLQIQNSIQEQSRQIQTIEEIQPSISDRSRLSARTYKRKGPYRAPFSAHISAQTQPIQQNDKKDSSSQEGVINRSQAEQGLNQVKINYTDLNSDKLEDFFSSISHSLILMDDAFIRSSFPFSKGASSDSNDKKSSQKENIPLNNSGQNENESSCIPAMFRVRYYPDDQNEGEDEVGSITNRSNQQQDSISSKNTNKTDEQDAPIDRKSLIDWVSFDNSGIACQLNILKRTTSNDDEDEDEDDSDDEDEDKHGVPKIKVFKNSWDRVRNLQLSRDHKKRLILTVAKEKYPKETMNVSRYIFDSMTPLAILQSFRKWTSSNTTQE